MTYQDKVKASKKVLEAIKALDNGEVIQFTYGTEYDYKSGKDVPKVFVLKAYRYDTTGRMSYSVYEDRTFGRGMNVDKITSTTIKLYSYDMMGTRTTYNMPLYGISTGLTIVSADSPIEEAVA